MAALRTVKIGAEDAPHGVSNPVKEGGNRPTVASLPSGAVWPNPGPTETGSTQGELR